MLQRLTIRNLAVIAELELDMTAGFCVLTGETGAGKSILIDAIGLVLGNRADSDLVRTGSKRAEIIAEFAPSPAAIEWLETTTLEDPDDANACVIRRAVNADGGSRAFVNGTPATAGNLRELGALLVDIHGQHESQRLLSPAVQRAQLDSYGGHAEALEAVRSGHQTLRDLLTEKATLTEASGADPQRVEFLRFQLAELDHAALQDGESEALDREQRALANAEQLIHDAHAAVALIGDDGGALSTTQRAAELLRGLAEMDAHFAGCAELAEAASAELDEAARDTQRRVDKLELDPARLAEVDARLSELHTLARKHQCAPEALPARAQILRDELASLEQADARLASLAGDIETARARYLAASKALSAARTASAAGMAESVTTIVRTLGLPDAQIRVDVIFDEQTKPSSHGQDQIACLVSTNPGQPPRPLAKVASGGELSRLSLAFQIVCTQDSAPPTMIFDEVDAGIGGGVADIVGKRLVQLAADRPDAQVLCVTHLPQVAAHGSAQFHVSKHVEGGQTQTRVEQLDNAQRVEELARMLGGMEISAQSRAHAQEMLEGRAKAA